MEREKCQANKMPHRYVTFIDEEFSKAIRKDVRKYKTDHISHVQENKKSLTVVRKKLAEVPKNIWTWKIENGHQTNIDQLL